MVTKYLFIDCETANPQGKICSIGYFVDDAADGHYTLIDPEDDFFWFNTRINHIEQKDVAGKPTFPQFCEESDFLSLLEDYVVVGHNVANADLHYIRKTLAAYGIAMPRVSYVDTYAMALADKRGLPGKLKDLCPALGVDLSDHYNALADAWACREVFHMLADYSGLPESSNWDETCRPKAKGVGIVIPDGSIGLTNKTNQPLEEILAEFESNGLRAYAGDFDGVKDVNFVVTGVVPGFPGSKVIENELKRMGARAASSVSGKTDCLVIGHNAGNSKIADARKCRTKIMTVSDLLELMSA